MLQRKDHDLLLCDVNAPSCGASKEALPSIPRGSRRSAPPRASAEERLGSIFSDVPIGEGDVFSRPTAGGGGFGDPLERDPNLVIEDIKDDYVSIGRAAKDYGVVVHAIDAELCRIRLEQTGPRRCAPGSGPERISNARLDPEIVRSAIAAAKLDTFDVIRQHAVILDWAPAPCYLNPRDPVPRGVRAALGRNVGRRLAPAATVRPAGGTERACREDPKSSALTLSLKP